MRSFVLLFLSSVLLWATAVSAAVTIALPGGEEHRIEDVYQQDGTVYIALDDLLQAVGLRGQWDSVKHSYKISSPAGTAEVSPGSRYLKLGGEFSPLQENPRFIDGRLRVTDQFVRQQLPLLTLSQVIFVNLEPGKSTGQVQKQNRLNSLFSFLLNRKEEPSSDGPVIRAIAIDPGHGGSDTGVIGVKGSKEKEIVLDYAEKLARQIKMKLGIPVYLSRDGDYELTAEKRLQSATREDVDIWIRLHAQGGLSAQSHGICLFARPRTAETEVQPAADSLLLADTLAQALRDGQFAVQGVYQSSRLSLGRGNLPTVQIELGYLTNPDELKQLQDNTYQQQLIAALYQGIESFAVKVKEDRDGAN